MRVLPSTPLILALLLATVSAQQQSERQILQELYTNTGGASWNTKTGWEDNASNICDWHGIICQGQEDKLNGGSNRRSLQGGAQVIGLYLKGNNLSGRVPPSLWRLPKLAHLVLSDNQVDVDFSQESSQVLKELRFHSTSTTSMAGIGKFQALETLHMSGTRLGNVVISQELLSLTNLQELHMAECDLEGTIPVKISQLSLLRQLNFYNNALTGTVPNSLGGLNQLQELILSRNNLQGTIPNGLASLAQLERLYLDHNRLTGTLPAFSTTPNLYNFFVDDNHLTGNVPSSLLAGYTKADVDEVRIKLDHNSFTGAIPSALDALAAFPVKITFADNLIQGFQDDSLCDNVNWMEGDEVKDYGCDAIICPAGTVNDIGRRTESLKCESCKESSYMGGTACLNGNDQQILEDLYKATGGAYWKRNDGWLKYKDFCDWYGITCWQDGDEQVGNKIGRVRKVELGDNGLIGDIPSNIFGMDKMTMLNLNRNKIVLGFDGIETTHAMFLINVAHTDTTTFDGIQNAHDFFEILIADQLDLQGTVPKEIVATTSLKILSMNECDLTGLLSTNFGKMTNLKELYLWGNSFRAQLPSELGLLTKLSVLSLAKNRLTGTLPAALNDLTALQALSLKNQVSKGGGMSGAILPFSNAPQLTSLHLAYNVFEGPVPSNLLGAVDDEAVVTVDLTSNVMEGTIPGQLARFSNMNLHVEDNLISKIDNSLCEVDGWMGGLVGEFGCEAILCPQYTQATNGHRIYDGERCEDCPGPLSDRKTLGQSQCGAKDFVVTERNVVTNLYESCNGQNWKRQEKWNSNEHVCEWEGISCDDAKSIVSIVLGNNNIQGTLPTYLWSLPNLNRLSMFGNDIHIDFTGIEESKNLQELTLDKTGLTTLEGVGLARGLIELNVKHNSLTGTIPSVLSRLVNMQVLELSHNRFTGELPSWLGRMPELTGFLADDNQITGRLAPFGNFPKLELLNISSNLLTGPIPDSFLLNCDRDQKIYVDIANNQLEGTLPYDLQRLNRLSLNAKQNKLTGVNPELCTRDGWNDYDVQSFGCDGILCPAGTYNDKGRQSNADNPCKPCRKAAYMGTTSCSGAFTRIVSFSLAIAAAMTGFFIF